jgi:hypothetical protein
MAVSVAPDGAMQVSGNAREPPFRDEEARAQRTIFQIHPSQPARKVKPQSIKSDAACCHAHPKEA